MFTAEERERQARCHGSAMEHFRALARLERRSDGPGEGEARKYILQALERAGIACRVESEPGILSFGGRASVRLSLCDETLPAKAWNFSVPTPPGGVSGRTVVLNADDFPSGPLDYLTSDARRHEDRRDLEDCVVLSRVSSPWAVRDAQARGAVAYVICWPSGSGPGGDALIHESGLVMWWGLPMPEETGWLPSIPVVAVSALDGDALIDSAAGGSLNIESGVVEEVLPVHLAEATIPSVTGDPHFVLVGAHLDSKHLGATDNATGAALALALAEELSRLENRRLGVRICWWSGHEFARYTGSSLYARKNFADLERYCVACTNIDMPGIRGSDDFGQVTAGPDLFEIAAAAVRDATGQEGRFGKRVRAWDQSFQNIGISSFFVWSSLLPHGSPYRTEGDMPWWWHTEADTEEFCDPAILEKDAAVYLTGLSRLLSGDVLPDVPALGRAVLGRLAEIEAASNGTMDLKSLRDLLEDGMGQWKRAASSTPSPDLSTILRAVRLLNRIYLSARDAHLQDRGGVDAFVPGLSEACVLLRKGGLSPRREVIVRHYAETQRNRILLLGRELEELIG